LVVDIAQLDAPEITDRQKLSWAEDAANLDQASTTTLQERFRAWFADGAA
jgi:hypothetical protein